MHCSQVWRPVHHAASTSLLGRSSQSSASGGSSSDSALPPPSHRRTSPSDYMLVGQTFVDHTQTRLRVVDVSLDPGQQIRVHRGDVLGLYFPDQNPIGWSSVPCADRNAQRYRVVASPSNVALGRSLQFGAAPVDDPSPCRHYSYIAEFGTFSTDFSSSFCDNA